jgi:hypothetical protein
MLKYVLATVAVALVSGTAQADEAITTPQLCLSTVDQLAQTWENHKYASKAEKDKIGTGLASLEKQCEENQLADAQKTAVELKALIIR